MYKICFVEDEKNLSRLIQSYLEKEKYEVIACYSGKEAMEYVSKLDIKLWILDIMLADSISGYDILKEVRKKNPDVPVIFTSARDQDLDKIIGLELGSDDYITKPYSPKELVLRVNNIIKRVYTTNKTKLVYEPYIVDQEKRLVYKKEKIINLTTLEYDLLILLLKHNDQSFSREDILNKIWGEDYFGSDRVVDDLVRRLRKKMPKLNINTIYGFGYRLT